MTTDPHGRHLTGAAYPYEETPPMSRPKPISDAVKYVGTGISAVLGVVQTLVLLGVLSNEQADQINQLGAAATAATPVLADSASTVTAVVGGLITIATGIVASFGVAKTAEAKVTPLEDPQSSVGLPLVEAPSAGPAL